MIKAKHDGQYKQVGFIKVRQPDGTYKDVEKKYGKTTGGEYGLVFEKGFTREAEGELPLTLNGIGKPLKNYTIEGNAYQSDGVSPDTPQEVVRVGERTGNLITNETTTAGYYLDSSGILNNVSHEYLKYLQPVEVKPNTTYTLSTNIIIYTYWTSDVSDTINKGIKRVYVNDSKVTITTGENERYLRISISERNAGFEWIMLNKGTEPLPYEPYGYRIPVVTRGKNLVKISDDNYIIYSSYSGFTISNNSLIITGATLMGFKVEVEPNTTYSVSSVYSAIPTGTTVIMRIREYSAEPIDWESNFIIQSVNALNSATFTTSAETKYVLVAFYVSGQGAGMTISNIQLELGSTATKYTPYVEPITTPIYLDSPLYKIGDYSDSRGKTEEVRVAKELILTGEENWRLVSTGRFVLSSITDYLRENDKLICYTTHYLTDKNTSNVEAVADKRAFFYFSSGNTWTDFYIKDSSFSTLNDFRAYLSAQYSAGTPVTVYYVLATPETKVVEPVEIPTLNGTTVIDVDTEVKPSNMWVEYKSSK